MWKAISPIVLGLFKDELNLDFGDGEDGTKPVLGDIDSEGKDEVSFGTLKEAFMDEDTIVKLLYEGDSKLIGFTFAYPYATFNTDWKDTPESKAAYIYGTAIARPWQRNKLVRYPINDLYETLHKLGYKQARRDVKVDNGYSATVQKVFGDQAGAIISASEPVDKFKLGDQVHFVTSVPKYVAYLEKNGSPYVPLKK